MEGGKLIIPIKGEKQSFVSGYRELVDLFAGSVRLSTEEKIKKCAAAQEKRAAAHECQKT